MTDRPALKPEEIIVTPEMARAGMNTLYGYRITEPETEEMLEAVSDVYRTMRAMEKEAKN